MSIYACYKQINDDDYDNVCVIIQNLGEVVAAEVQVLQRRRQLERAVDDSFDLVVIEF